MNYGSNPFLHQSTLSKTFFKCLQRKTSDIIVEESPAESSDEVQGEADEERDQGGVLVLGPDVGLPSDEEGPNTHGDQSRGETD